MLTVLLILALFGAVAGLLWWTYSTYPSAPRQPKYVSSLVVRQALLFG
jgi:hypothetical protein